MSDSVISNTLVNTLAARSPVRRSLGEGGSTAIRFASVLFITTLTVAAAQISVPLPFTDVPLTLTPMVVLLGGMALGARLGMTSQLLYLALGMAGLPVFAASPVLPPGILRLVGPTGGYLMAYPLAAFLVGLLAERGYGRSYISSFLTMLVGLIVIFAGGAAWLALQIGVLPALAAGVIPFVAADLLKLLVAAAFLPGMWRLIGRASR
jgi:biotin transport system substrate-specific component